MTFLAEPTPHEQAAAFLRGLPAVDRDTFNRLPDEFKASAFLVTGITAHDALQDVRDLLATVPGGADFEDVRAKVQARLEPLMGGNAKAARARATLVSRFHVNRAYSLGETLQLDNHTGAFPFRKRLTVGDEKVRDSHRALHGVILPATSPAWEFLTPPGPGWNCRCYIVGVTRREAEATRDAEEADIAAGKLDPAKRLFLDGPMLKQLEQSRILTRGLSEQYNFSDLVTFNPRTLLMPLDQIRARYDDRTWAEFEKWAKGQTVNGKSLYERLLAARPAGAVKAAPVPPSTPAPVPAPAAPVKKPKPAKPAPALPPDPDSVAAHVQVRVKTGPVAEAAREGLRAIGQVHGDGGLKNSPLRSKHSNSWYGVYVRQPTGSGPADFDSWININPAGDHATLTTLHELGHKVDMEAIAWIKRDGETPRDIYHAAAWTVRQRLLAALRQTQRAADLAASSEVSLKMKSYALQGDELFARAYAQYIATRSGNAAAAEALAKDLAHPRRRLLQWPADEFAGIAPLFDELIETLGWKLHTPATP